MKLFVGLIFLALFAVPCAAEKLLCVTNVSKGFSYSAETKQREVIDLNLPRRYTIESAAESNGSLAISIEGDAEPFIICPAITNNVLGYTRCNNVMGVFRFNNNYKKFTYLHAYTDLEEGGTDSNSPSVEFGRCTTYQERQ